jgi:hypothetical protein
MMKNFNPHSPDCNVCDSSDVQPIETEDRRSSGGSCVYSVLCKEDKEQLDRIEAMLGKLMRNQ